MSPASPTVPWTTKWAVCGAAAFVVLVTNVSDAKAPAGRFVVGVETIQDTMTGLVWERVAPPSTMSWDDGTAHCSKLAGAAFRLPTPNELLTIVDVSAKDPAVDVAVFTDVHNGEAYWTSAIRTPPDLVWVVYISSGTLYAPVGKSETTAYRARCVAVLP